MRKPILRFPQPTLLMPGPHTQPDLLYLAEATFRELCAQYFPEIDFLALRSLAEGLTRRFAWDFAIDADANRARIRAAVAEVLNVESRLEPDQLDRALTEPEVLECVRLVHDHSAGALRAVAYDRLQDAILPRSQQTFDETVQGAAKFCARTYSGCRDLADDIAQEVRLRFYSSNGRITSEIRLIGWICLTARNVAREFQRKVRLEIQDLSPDGDGEGPNRNRDGRPQPGMWRSPCSIRLSPEDERLLRLLAAGHTSEQIGARIGTSGGAARVRLHRLCQELRLEDREEILELVLRIGHDVREQPGR